MTPEGAVKKKIREFLKIRGYVFSPVQMGMGVRTVDILACIAGRFVAIEVKRPGKKPTALQFKIMHDIETAGGIVGWFDDYLTFLQWWSLLFPVPTAYQDRGTYTP